MATDNTRPWRLTPAEQFRHWIAGLGFDGRTAMVVFNQSQPVLLRLDGEDTELHSLGINNDFITAWQKQNRKVWPEHQAKPYIDLGHLRHENSVFEWLTDKAKKADGGTFMKMGIPHFDADKNTSMGNAGFEAFRLAWFESDNGSHIEQRRRIRRFEKATGIKPWLVSSGSKSVHGFIAFDADCPFAEVEAVIEMLVPLLDSDPTVATKHRQMRAPGFPRPSKGTQQQLLQMGDAPRPLAEVRASLDALWAQHGWIYTPKRFASWVVARRTVKRGKPLPSSAGGDPFWYLQQDSPEVAFGGWLRGAYKRDDDQQGKPSPYRDDATDTGRKIKALETKLIEEHGLPGCYDIAAKYLASDNFTSFDFQAISSEIWAGYNPFSERPRHQQTGNSFRVFASGGWFDWGEQTGGKLADFLIWAVPGIDNAADPTRGEIDLLIRWMQKYAGIEDAELQKLADKIQGEPDIEKILEEVARIEREPDPAAVPIKQERFKAQYGVSYVKAREAYMARQEQIYCEQTTASLGDALMEKPKQQTWLIPGRLQAGSVVTLLGVYGTGKTTVVEGLLLKMIKGDEIEPGYPLPRPLRILYLQCELSKDQHTDLLREAGWAVRQSQGQLNNITMKWGWTWNNKGWLYRYLEDAIEAGNPYDLLVVDSVSGALGTMQVDENSLAFTQTTYAVLTELKNRLGIASLVIAHPNAEGTRHRGHSSAPGAVDHIWWLEPVTPEDLAKARRNMDLGFAQAVANADDYLQIRIQKHRGGFHTGPMLIRVDHATRTVKNYGVMYASGQEGPAKKALEEFLTARGNADAFALSFLQVMGGYGNYDAARKSLKRLVELGVVSAAPANPENKRVTYYRAARWGDEPVTSYIDGEQETNSTSKPTKAANALEKKRSTTKAAKATGTTKATGTPKGSQGPAPVAAVPDVGRSVDESELLPLLLDQLPAKAHPMAVKDETGTWRNGRVFWEVKGLEVHLGVRCSDGNYQGKWFCLEDVRVLKTEPATRAGGAP